MKENGMKEALENIVRRAVPEDLNLMPSIAVRLERKSLMTTIRASPVVTILIVLVLLALLTGAVYAIGKSTGFIPGVGFTEGNVYVLSTPVVANANGITVSVKNAVYDESK
jgi:hypothetical protein